MSDFLPGRHRGPGGRCRGRTRAESRGLSNSKGERSGGTLSARKVPSCRPVTRDAGDEPGHDRTGEVADPERAATEPDVEPPQQVDGLGVLGEMASLSGWSWLAISACSCSE